MPRISQPLLLYNEPVHTTIAAMSLASPMAWIVIGMMVLAAAVPASLHFFSTGSRLERRRRKNNPRVVNTARRPAVKLSVKTKKQ